MQNDTNSYVPNDLCDFKFSNPKQQSRRTKKIYPEFFNSYINSL